MDLDSEIGLLGQKFGIWHATVTQGNSVGLIIQKKSHLLFISHYSFKK